jgi:hypothetical protein
MQKSKMAFDFVVEHLFSLSPIVKPMFGCHSIYVGTKIVLVTRLKENHPEANGIWIATSREHHTSLKEIIPTMHSVYVLSNGKNETDWQMIHADDDNFETYTSIICDLILRSDVRIGKVPKPRKGKK